MATMYPSEMQLSVRDAIFTARGFLLRGIVAACENPHQEQKEWSVYSEEMARLNVKETYVGIHLVQYTLSDGSHFYAQRMDNGE